MFGVVTMTCPGLANSNNTRSKAARRRLPQSLHEIAYRKLVFLDNARSLVDLRNWQSLRLEKLKGDRKDQLLAGTPVGRIGTVADVADLITYLCRPESGYITGVTYDVNGGSHIH